MPAPPDLTDAELEDLVLNPTCTCTICRLGREVVRRRAAAKAIEVHVVKLAKMGLDVSVDSHFPGLASECCRLGAAFCRAEGKASTLLPLVEIDDLPLHSDNIHYDDRARELGEQMAAEAARAQAAKSKAEGK